MKNKAQLLWCAGVAVAGGLAFFGCQTPGDSPAVGKTDGNEISGSEAWSQTCGQCHNSISPNTYSDQQWDAIMMHMRIHARLTGEEERAIRKFLQASN